MKKLLLKKQEAAELLNLSLGNINYLIEEKKLEIVEIKSGVDRIKRSSVISYLKNENSNNKGLVSLRRLFIFLWIAAIVTFVIHLLISAIFGSEKYWQDWRIWLLLGNIGLGIIFFLAAFLTIGKKKNKTLSIARNTAWSLPIIYLLMTVIPALADVDLNRRNVTPSLNSQTPINNVTPTPTQVKPKNQVTTNTTGSQLECIGPDGKHFNTSMSECKKLAEQWGKPVDYMTNCNIHPDCGGGTVLMAKSECDKPCSGKKQITITSAPNNPTTPVSGSNYFCINNVTGFTYYTSSGEQCNKDNYKAICLDSAKKLYYNPCMDKCLRTANDTSSYCIYNLTGDAKTACLDQQQKDHQSCMDACGVIYQAENKKCY